MLKIVCSTRSEHRLTIATLNWFSYRTFVVNFWVSPTSIESSYTPQQGCKPPRCY